MKTKRSPLRNAALVATGAVGLLPALGRPAAAQTLYDFQFSGHDTVYDGDGDLGNGASAVSAFNQLKQTTVVGNGGVYAVPGGVVDSNNVASAVTLTVTADGGYSPATDAASGPTDPTALMQNFGNVFHGAAGPSKETGGIGDIALTGLAPNSPFTMDLYGVNGQFAGDGQETLFTLTDSGFVPLAGTAAQRATVVESADGDFYEGVNFATFIGTTGPTGCVYATYQAAVGNTAKTDEGDFNALQISVTPAAAPEPSGAATLGLAALGLAALALKARRRRADTSVQGQCEG